MRATTERQHAYTAVRVYRGGAWFRVHGHGLWLKWGRSRDLFSTRHTARYIGRLRWKRLRPDD